MDGKEPVIRIFSSFRIDIDSIPVDNPLIIPVRCGAVFDHRPSVLLGDDTGENISNRQGSFSELTVLYWAWKNVDADYYGLCHYRRYLSFADRTYPTDDHGMVARVLLNSRETRRFSLTDAKKMTAAVTAVSGVLPTGIAVSKMALSGGGNTVRNLWKAHEGLFFRENAVDTLLRQLDALSPDYHAAAEACMSGVTHRGYNCFILNRELFFRLCNFMFPILFELEKQGWGKDREYPRTLAYMGEILFGIFQQKLYDEGTHILQQRQIVFFEHTTPVEGVVPRAGAYAVHALNFLIRNLSMKPFPLGTKRRERLKKSYLILTGQKRLPKKNKKAGGNR